MGDMGDDFREWDKAKKEKKRSNLEWSTKRLKELGVEFESKNGGVHLIVKNETGAYDFYPSTGKYAKRGGKWRRGIRNLLKDMGVKYER